MKKPIITLPHSKLRQKSLKARTNDPAIAGLIEAMTEATLDWEDSREHEVGVALAAVQIGELKRVVIIRNDFEDKKNRSFTVFINPKIVQYGGEITEDFEGCLSIKDVYGKVPRYSKVKIAATDINGEPIRVTAEGFLARVFQHEIDHTNGIVFIDHIKDSPSAFYHLDKKGHLEPLNYNESIANNPDLWPED